MRNFFGLIIVLLGVAFLLQQFNVPHADRLIAVWWPLVVIAVGVVAWSSNPRQWFGPLVIMLVGVILLVDQMNIMAHSAWNVFWPVIIIVVGGRILMGRAGGGGEKTSSGSADANALFSGVDRKVTDNFTGNCVSAWFGGVKLDLREAKFTDKTELCVSAGFGGVEVWVPKTVKVVTKVMPIFGGAEDKTTPVSNAVNTLTITGTVIFGGVTIRN
jgi:predicted membrane protein